MDIKVRNFTIENDFSEKNLVRGEYRGKQFSAMVHDNNEIDLMSHNPTDRKSIIAKISKWLNSRDLQE